MTANSVTSDNYFIKQDVETVKTDNKTRNSSRLYNISKATFMFLLFKLVIPSQQRCRGYSNAAVRVWLGECVRE